MNNDTFGDFGKEWRARQDFRRARFQADVEAIIARLRGQSPELLSFDQIQQQLNGTPAGDRQLRDIPLDAIVGSVGRSDDFTRHFFPRKDHDESRWIRVEQAMFDAQGFPPIEVYQIGDAYFVLDGNHRVSVARQAGYTAIEAYVTEIRTKVPFSPDITPAELIVKARYADFLERTGLDKLRPEADLTTTEPGHYRLLDQQIQQHQHTLRREQGRAVTFTEAAGDWHDTVYQPVIDIIRDRGVLWDFPHRTETDLYLWLTRYCADLARQFGWEVEPQAAATALSDEFSPRLPRRVARLGERVLDALIPDPLEAGPIPGQWRQEKIARHPEDRLFSHVLVALSNEPGSEAALDQALEITRREAGQVFGLHLVSSAEQIEHESSRRMRSDFQHRCEAAGVAGKMAIEVGPVVRKLCERARWSDLVVVHLAHPPGSQPLARLGSGLGALIRRCPRPILAVPDQVSTLRQLLLAFDGSPKANEALFVAAYLAESWQLPLVVVTVVDERHPPAILAQAQAYLATAIIDATFIEGHGPAGTAIIEQIDSHQADLILMGGYGLNPVLEVTFGSTVDQVLREVRRPILICR